MGIGNGIFVILEASIPWGKEQDRTPGNERERDRVRERYPSFQKRDAHALRFGSMNPITICSDRGPKRAECDSETERLQL